jgi:hypothetical protein
MIIRSGRYLSDIYKCCEIKLCWIASTSDLAKGCFHLADEYAAPSMRDTHSIRKCIKMIVKRRHTCNRSKSH